MDDPDQISEYGKILLMAMVGIVLVSGTIFLARVLSPKNPNPIKLSSYECGEDTIGSAWVQINPRFYVIALVFLLFDVELIFIFPWATVFGNAALNMADSRWGWLTMAEMAIFIGVLIVGLWYVWVRGDISWIRPTHRRPEVQVGIPGSAYQNLNQKNYEIRKHREERGVEVMPAAPKRAPAKLGFRPKFGKTNQEE